MTHLSLILACKRTTWKAIKNAYTWEPCPEIPISKSNVIPRNLHFSKHLGVVDIDNSCIIL